MHEATVKNFRQVEKGLTQLERTINRLVMYNDLGSVDALVPVQLLLVSIKAEARIMKIVYMRDGLTPDERESVLSETKAVERWLRIIDIAFRRHYRVAARRRLEDQLDHDVLAKRTTMHDLISNELEPIIALRNKLAHGQWVVPLNTPLTAAEPSAIERLRSENTLTLKFRDNLIKQLGNTVVDLVQSAPGFEALFDQRFEKIRENRRWLKTADYDDWCANQRSKKPALQRVDPDSSNQLVADDSA
jgi:hypothetical protein